MMAVEEHRATALAFLDASDREFDAGDVLQASEKLWGAFSHAVTAVCKQRGWDCGTHRQLINSARQLVAEDGASYHTPGDLVVAIAEARHFHNNFYNGSLEDYEIEAGRPPVRAFVQWAVNLTQED
jgi:hypothetical protein